MSFKEHSLQNLVIGGASIACLALVLLLNHGSLAAAERSTIAEFVFGLLFAGVGLFFLLRGGFWWVPPWCFRSRWITPQGNSAVYRFNIGIGLVLGAALLLLGILRLIDPSIPGVFTLLKTFTKK